MAMYSPCSDRGSLCRVAPFRYPRITRYLLLPVAFRSLSRLSSALSAKASTLCSLSLDLDALVHASVCFQCSVIYSQTISSHCLTLYRDTMKLIFLFFDFRYLSNHHSEWRRSCSIPLRFISLVSSQYRSIESTWQASLPFDSSALHSS